MSSHWTLQYYQKVLALNPFAYWMMDEKGGAVTYDLVSDRVAGAQNGAYTGVTLGQPGIGDGRTAPFFDGINDYSNVYSAELNTAFDGTAGSMMAWVLPSPAAWTDGAIRVAVLLFADGDNLIRLDKSATNNRWDGIYRAGAVSKQVVVTPSKPTTFSPYCITWDKVVDEVRVYDSGDQFGATLASLGVWAGNLSATRCVIGANSLVPANAYDGWLAHVALWNRALTSSEVVRLSVPE